MENTLLILYIPVALISVLWSFWAHGLWEKIPGLKDDSGWRTWALLSGPTWFLVLAFTGSGPSTLPLDFIGMVPYGIVMLLGLAAFGFLGLLKHNKKQVFLWMFISVQALALLILAILLLSHMVLPLRVWLAIWLEFLIQMFEGRGFELFQPVDPAGNLNFQLDKIFIALISYLPMSIFRILYTQHLFRGMRREISLLKNRLDRLEKG